MIPKRRRCSHGLTAGLTSWLKSIRAARASRIRGPCKRLLTAPVGVEPEREFCGLVLQEARCDVCFENQVIKHVMSFAMSYLCLVSLFTT